MRLLIILNILVLPFDEAIDLKDAASGASLSTDGSDKLADLETADVLRILALNVLSKNLLHSLKPQSFCNKN